ncbi:MAG: hypothetical protein NZ480_06080, partial [Bdellovibrionaceae bacterium]|nr:hypothetical protein [Pseudobdellovibrionaceae bacterium]MDW8190578.1 hypothetical protein [Pseudobdellovibrionaceae bacterium]
PLFRKESLFQFSVEMVLSPYIDKMTVLGKSFDIPGNISIPEQKETYVFPITLSKPTYRLGFYEPGPQTLVTLNGTFPIRPVFDGLQEGLGFAGVLNHFDMRAISFQNLTVSQNQQVQNIQVNQFALRVTEVQAPRFDDQREALFLLGLGVLGQAFYPTDVKRFDSLARGSLKTFGNGSHILVVKRFIDDMEHGLAQERLSARLVQKTMLADLGLLPLLGNPVVQAGGLHILMRKAPVSSGLVEFASVYRLNLVRPIKQKDRRRVTFEEKQALWEVYLPGWVEEVQLPRWPGSPTLPAGSKRWSLSLFAADKALDLDEDPFIAIARGEATHVTHANVNF